MKEDILKTTFPRLTEPIQMLKALEIAMLVNAAIIGGAILMGWRGFAIIMTANLIALAWNYKNKRKEYKAEGGRL